VSQVAGGSASSQSTTGDALAAGAYLTFWLHAGAAVHAVFGAWLEALTSERAESAVRYRLAPRARRRARHRAAWILGWLTAGLAIAATAFSRVELGVHWITDVIAGVVFVAASDASADDRGGNMACRSSGLAQGGQAAPRCRGTRTHRFTVVRLIF